MDLTEQIEYYKQRAKEYDSIYEKPERQSDLNCLHEYFSDKFENKDIIEIACGTGYWTKYLLKKARSVLATDINDEVLEIAKAKLKGMDKASFFKSDFNKLTTERKYEGLFGGFIWSHIPL